ncbi:unnamed protein product [marine sediment metagenome]|uniref:Uncharacterized protein n=1 Tax=marine sediment metagenome TaxID=412755 RepID=X0RY84_9ZZZZ
MSEKHAGWKLVLKINGKDVYFHKGRDTYAIERDHYYLVGLTESEQRSLDWFLLEEARQMAEMRAAESIRHPDYRERPICGVSRNVRLGMEVW